MMPRRPRRSSSFLAFALPALALLGLAGIASPARAAANFPDIPIWSMAGAWQDSSHTNVFLCPGLFHGPGPDSLVARERAVTVRFMRDRRAEARPDFGGYRLYRMVNTRDTTYATLIRRFSLNSGSELTWSASVLNPLTMEYECQGQVASDSILTFVDPDSNGSYQKVCRRYNAGGQCISPGDSVIALVAPPGPHDGFQTWYSVTYEKKNTTDTNFEDLFVDDGHGVNLNNKSHNLTGPITPTGGPTRDLETVRVVPNPFRGTEAWDHSGLNEIHFLNLPTVATVKIFTLAGDLVRTLHHSDSVNDFEVWDLRSDSHRDVASGIYIFRVEATVKGTPFNYQNRFVVIR